MNKVIISVLSFFILFLSACGADVDEILQSGSAVPSEAESEEMDPLSAQEPESDFQTVVEEEPDRIYVYICGAVDQPGVYELKSQSRVYELVEMAGGLTEEADEKSVNLAQTVEDGEMVRILTREESASGLDTNAGLTGTVSENEPDAGKVNINTADVTELISLNGIGEAKAAAIVAYREEHGPFGSPEEIMEVPGIAEGIYARIKDYITI
ncbi:MAG: ComEA family DNA-binding protein [Lachnospiraceae bacterium]|nr:ComEA family DNA-binding protein [Lachnospiraceae bacterium]